MKRQNFYLLFFLFSSFAPALIAQPSLPSQEIPALLADTAATEPPIINISEISIRSSLVSSEFKKSNESLLSEQEIEKIKTHNDSLIDLVNRKLKEEREDDPGKMNSHQLNNKEVYWKQMASIIDIELKFLSDKIKTIGEEHYKLLQEADLWKNTRDAMIEDGPPGSVLARVNETILYLDELGEKINAKNENLLVVLDRTSELDFLIYEYLDKLEEIQNELESKIFSRHHNAIYSINWADTRNWNPVESIREFYQSELYYLTNYLKLNQRKIYFLVFLLILLPMAFRAFKMQIIDKGIKQKSLLGKQLARLVEQPSVVGIILALFSTLVFLRNRPEIFDDILLIILIVPLILIIYNELNKQHAKPLILTGILAFLQTLIYLFPPDHLLYRLLIYTIATGEMWLVWILLKYFSKHPLSRTILDKLLFLLLIFNLLVPFIGLIAVSIGATMLANEAVSLPIVSVSSAALLIVAVIIIGGLIEMGIDSQEVKKLNVIRQHAKYLKSKIIGFISLAAGVYWFIIFLRSVKIDRKVFEGISVFIKNEINIGSANFTLGDILTFILVIWISALISRILQNILEKDILNRFKLAKGIPYTVGLMVRYAIITLGIFLAVSAAGLPIASLGILIGAMGVGIGFGLQNIFNNLVSGLILLFERPIQLGDIVEVGELKGHVKSIGIRSSNVRTFDGAEVIVPNGQFISSEVVNWTLSDRQRRVEVLAGVAYGSDPHQVRKLLLEGLKKHPDINETPPPNVYFNKLGESSLDFRILFWTNNIGEWLRIQSEVVYMVHDILVENGIQIPFPQRDLHIKSMQSGSGIIKKGNKE